MVVVVKVPYTSTTLTMCQALYKDLHVLSHLSLIKPYKVGSLCFPHFINKETETELLRHLPKSKDWSLNLSKVVVPRSVGYTDHARELTEGRCFCEPSIAHGMWGPLNAS